jgi:hypothetical protein
MQRRFVRRESPGHEPHRLRPPQAAVILAAGQGTRMKSPTPKVLHKIAAGPCWTTPSTPPRRWAASGSSWWSGPTARRRRACPQAPGRGGGRHPGSAAGHRPRRAGRQGRPGRFRRRRGGDLRRLPAAERPDHRAAVRPARLGRRRGGAGLRGRRSGRLRPPDPRRPIMCCCASSRPRTPTTASGRSSCAIPACWPPTARPVRPGWPMWATTTPTANTT